MTKLLLNCDMGESFGSWKMGQDLAVMPHIDQANIACGFHASDPQVMDATIKLAKKYAVSIGAHPGYADLVGFGRRTIPCSENEIITLVLYQVGAICSLCEANDVTLDYVKPHGALYNDMMKNEPIFTAIIYALSLLNKPLALMIQAGPKQKCYAQLAKAKGIPLIFEAFLDRRYLEDGSLMPRSEQGSVLTEAEELLSQAKNLQQGFVISNMGSQLAIIADSLCVHGDNLAALKNIEKLASLIKSK